MIEQLLRVKRGGAELRPFCREARVKHRGYSLRPQRVLTDLGAEASFGHRQVIQQRLKLAGYWWKETHAPAMLNLRIVRANNFWNAYWSIN